MIRSSIATPLFLAFALALGSLSIGAASSFAQSQPTEEEIAASREAFLSSLDFQSGNIELSDANAELTLGEDHYKFLDSRDTERLLVDAWGNPPGMQVIGSIVPARFDLTGNDTWAVIITYEEDGYVSDEDAASIDYDEMLQTMQQETAAANDQREAAGYGRIELVGWAESPYYDSESNKLYWAKELRFNGSDTGTLNYNIRALGRKGVLVLNAVGSMDQYSSIRDGMQDVLRRVRFDEGSQYADFDPSIDEVAAYGIGALVAGKLAAKVGLLAKAAPLLLVLKKFWIVGAIAVAGFARKMFGGRSAGGGGAGVG
jgi:uncharacterized membrane-anchored protein